MDHHCDPPLYMTAVDIRYIDVLFYVSDQCLMQRQSPVNVIRERVMEEVSALVSGVLKAMLVQLPQHRQAV